MTDLTVVIPTRNRAKMLSDLLDSLKVQKSEGLRWEILVIDNGSTDDTSSMVESKKKDFPVPLRYLYEQKLGLHNCRNRGAKEAKGTIIAFLDDDMILDEKWIQGARSVLNGRADIVGGKILPLWDAQPPDWTKAFFSNYQGGNVLGYLGLIDLGDEVKAIDAYHAFGGNCFVSRDVVFELKGYHPDSMPQELIRFRGDGETGFSMKFMQYKLVSIYEPIALAYHRINADRLTIDYICKRAYNQGISDSFTKIRKEHGLYRELNETAIDNSFNQSGLEKSIRIIFRLMVKIQRLICNHLCKVISSLFLSEQREIVKIKKQIGRCYEGGFAFHQNEVKNDQKLLEWVLRENYLGKNGELPI